MPYRCPYCNLTFCEEHIAQKKHNCIALSRKIKSNPPVEDTVSYGESLEAPMTRSRHYDRRRKKGVLGLGVGVTPRKMMVVALTLAISLGSLLLVNSNPAVPETPGAGPVFPTTPEVVELQEYVLQLINEERTLQQLEELELDTNPIAQRYAESMLETGEFKHNPELPGTMGENIKHYSKADLDEEEALRVLMYEMVYDDADYEWGHRDNILSEDYVRVSVGVAIGDGNLYLVQDFS